MQDICNEFTKQDTSFSNFDKQADNIACNIITAYMSIHICYNNYKYIFVIAMV